MSMDNAGARPLRLGILGCANIARQFARDVAPSAMVRLAAVASRKAETAAAFAADTGIGRHFGSYEDLLADDQIDAVYIPLPNSLHAAWAIRAAQCGKHILCEKPLALNLAEAQAMFEAARRHGVMLLEAYPYQFQPQTAAMLDLLRKAAIGEVRSVQALFGFPMLGGNQNIRMQPALGGGALLDAGSYPLSLIRMVMGEAPQRVRADASWASTGVDISMSGTLFYADGRRAQFACAMNVANQRRAIIAGAQGTIETEFLNHTSDVPAGDEYGYLPSQLRVRRGGANTIPFEDIRTPTGSGFRFAAEAFARAVSEGDNGLIDQHARLSLDTAATLEALALSAREDRTVGL